MYINCPADPHLHGEKAGQTDPAGLTIVIRQRKPDQSGRADDSYPSEKAGPVRQG